MRGTLLLAFLLAALLALAGCGGDSKEDIVEKGNEICKEADEKGEDLEEPQSATDFATLEEYAAESADIIEDGLAEFDELDPPDEDRDAYDEFIEVSEEQVDKIRDLEDAAANEDEAEVTSLLGELEELDEESDDAAQEYGMDECGDD